MKFIQDWWIHITGGLATILAFIFKDKIGDIVKALFGWLMRDTAKSLEEHKADDERKFNDIKQLIFQSEERIIRANDSTKTDIMMALNHQAESNDRRFGILEKVFLDSRLK